MAAIESGLMASAAFAQPLAAPDAGADEGQAVFKAGGGKFYPSGHVREWPGNTIVCPVEPDTLLHEALRSVQEDAMTQAVMRKFTLLPTSSLHMTVMDGLDLDHRRAPFWPASVPLDAPLSTATTWCLDRLRTFHTGGGRFGMRPDPSDPPPQITGFSLALQPASDRDEGRIRAVRDRLSALLEIRQPNFDGYRFHITLGYLIERLTPDETQEVRQLYRSWFTRVAATAPEFLIGPPVFCTFRDMFAFTPALTLAD